MSEKIVRPEWVDQMAECLAVTGDTDTEQALLRQLVESARWAKQLEAEKAELEARIEKILGEWNEAHCHQTSIDYAVVCAWISILRGEVS